MLKEVQTWAVQQGEHTAKRTKFPCRRPSRIALKPQFLVSFHCQPGYFGKFFLLCFSLTVKCVSPCPHVPSIHALNWQSGTRQGGTPIHSFLHSRILFGCSWCHSSRLWPGSGAGINWERFAEVKGIVLIYTHGSNRDGCIHLYLCCRAGPNLQTNIGPMLILFGKSFCLGHVGCWSYICQIKRAQTGTFHSKRVQIESKKSSP